MLDGIRNHTQGWLAKLILALITVPFALFGIDSYFNQAASTVAVATVGKNKISLQEFGNALESVRNNMQADGKKVDVAMFDRPEFKQSVLDGLVIRRLVEDEVKHANFHLSDQQLSQHIMTMPNFHENGKFSEELYYKTLQDNGLSTSRFEQNLRADLLTQQVRDGISNLAYVPKTTTEKLIKQLRQQREISIAELKYDSFADQVKVSSEQVQAYFDQHKDKFKAPEQVKVEFLLMSVAHLIPTVNVSDQEIKEFYDQNLDKLQGDEQRHAAHILFAFDQKASQDEKNKVKTKAEDVLKQLKKDPRKFEELAKKYSQDPGSAGKGGDLGNFGRGSMVKAFENAVFAMEVGKISDLVESEYGYHIIKLIEASGQSASFENLKVQIKGDLLYKKAQEKFAEISEEFKSLVYEQSTSLQPVAKHFNLQTQISPLLSKEDLAKMFNDKVATLAFSNEVLKEKRNSEAIDISANDLVSIRVLEHKAVAPRSFDEVKVGIEKVLKLEQAKKMAKAEGETILAKLKNGAEVDHLDWITPIVVDRKNTQEIPAPVIVEAFKLTTDKLPTYSSIEQENKSYTIVKVIGVNDDAAKDETVRKKANQELQSVLSAEYAMEYQKLLKSQATLEVNRKLLLGEQQ